MTAPQKLYGVSLKPRVKTPPRKLIQPAVPETHPDLLEAVRRAVIEQRELADRPSSR
jgi:hypothetical protein